MTYHMENWEYFIELACYKHRKTIDGLLLSAVDVIEELPQLEIQAIDPDQFTKYLESNFQKIRCAKSREGLETILLDIISENIKNINPETFDRILKRLDIYVLNIKERWAYEHTISLTEFYVSGREKIYHMQNWKYFIDLSCYNPELMKEFLYDAAIDEIKEEKTFREAVNALFYEIRCARTIEGLESILLDIINYGLIKWEKLDPIIFDKILKRLDGLLSDIKQKWAEEHVQDEYYD